MPSKLTLEVAPDQIFFPGVNRRFVVHLNPTGLSYGTEAVYARVLPPGSYIELGQWVSTRENDITFSILLNEHGAHPEDLNIKSGHLTVADSIKWLQLACRPVANSNNRAGFSAPPILLLIFGSRDVVPVEMIGFTVNETLLDEETLQPIRAEVSITLKKHRKIII